MGMYSLRSLLVAAIVLSNCITWTACRHHYTHNVNGHRSRHRRQGAGLYLPASYILPGGEGGGAWGEWGNVSPCSRTCGGGVASQKRICLEFGSDGSPLCTGGDTKYFSCQTQDCPDGSGDFRAGQCAAYDSKTFRGQTYNWVPYTKGPNPCELNCMPRGERFYYRQQHKVVDGTRCNDESFDVCVDGVCQPVGCDMMLGSNAREDKCRVCRGNGTNCYTTSGLLDSQDYIKGYNDILLIPQGATNIVIEEVRESTNYLALRAKLDNKYYLNGDYHIDFPRPLIIASALWYYERSQQGLAAPDKLRCMGPTSEPLYLSLLLQDENVGIRYEYSVPSSMAPPLNQEYNWVFGDFSECTTTCGGGYQTRQVTCRSREKLQEVEETLCDIGLKPATNQDCNMDACPPEWVEDPWGPCSKACGDNGTRSRNVYCQMIITNGYPSIVADKECFDRLGPKPESYQECNRNATCPTWFTGPWKACDKLRGEGQQTRLVICHQRINSRVEVYDDEFCTEEKPIEVKSCILHPAKGVDWILSDWSGCDTCLSTVRTREAQCVTQDRRVVAPDMCSYHPAPVLEEPCKPEELPGCQVLWYATQWGKCSVDCGEGIQTRRVFCGLFNGEAVIKVDDSRCDPSTKYNSTKKCSVPKEKCPAKWFTGLWTECDKPCDGGNQTRYIMCLKGDTKVLDCNELTIPDSMQTCNTHPCNKDEMLPVNSTASITDDYEDYEDCEDEDKYPDEAAEADDVEVAKFPDWTTKTEDFTTSEYGSGSGHSIYDDGSPMSTDDPISTMSDAITEDSTSVGTVTTESDTTNTGTTILDTTELAISEVSTTNSDITGSTEMSVALPGITVTTDISTETDTTESGTIESSTKESDTTESDTMESDTTESDTTESDTIESDTAESDTTESNTTESDTTESDTTESDTTESDTTESDTTEAGTTESCTTESDTESVTTESGTTDSGTTESSTTESGTTESGTTESETTESDTTESDTTESDTTESDTTESDTTESDTTESDTTESDTTESGTTESGTTESDTTESSTTESGTTESGTTESGTTESGTTDSGTKESGTTESGTTEIGTTELGTTASITKESATTESVTIESSTIELATKESDTTEIVTTESGTTESATKVSATIESASKDSAITETPTTTESGTTEATIKELSTIEASATKVSSTESITTEVSTTEAATTSTIEGSMSSTTETSSSATETDITVSTEISTSTIESKETPEISSSVSEISEASTTTSTIEQSTTEVSVTKGTTGRTPWGWTTIVTTTKPPRCKEKKRKCARRKFGCCPDGITPATGPFDEGCPNPETCGNSNYGCCPDGVSAAKGLNHQGCPIMLCNETLYGCCMSDNITAAEGNDQDGCPPLPPACLSTTHGCCEDKITEAKGPEKEGCPETRVDEVTETEIPMTTEPIGCQTSEYGCCYDNETDASGPNGEGCPCSISEFGCCPDGVATAFGPNLEGCVMTCKTSAYGCCPDDETPAHGPDQEGCCLQARFGCCPDNYKEAQGPHLEGCGCQYAHFGCCPDNVTIARGPNKEGCGCQYTQFGCCQDRYTAAEGPEYTGCSCHTYQFGCCPDGVTVSTGPNLQGCICHHSKYGCCGDETTAARGPDMQGCDCSTSKYGCCPDGVTEAKGKKFLNCTDIPENKQAACALASDRGAGHDYTVNWFYDTAYGGCSRFWYSGSGGNGNRFSSQAECQDVCIHPSPKDACRLPKVKAVCTGYTVRWYYDSDREQCSQFVYGGCLGNSNNFESKELCQAQCEPQRTEDQCNMEIDKGSCAGNYPRWGYNSESHLCEQFTWGGCEGNSNRFSSEAACLLRCAPPGKPIQACSLPQDAGNCTEKQPAWSFSPTENRCVPFYYTGCGGNDNRFDSEQACGQACPIAHEQELCTLPAVTGSCSDYTANWFYDNSIKRCRQFYYGGCEGNKNNFVSERECENTCMEKEEPVTQPPTQPPTRPPTQPPTEPSTEPPKQPPTQPPTQPALQPRFDDAGERPEFCYLDIDSGPCNNFKQFWAFDRLLRTCVTFQYGGCGGNRNNFPAEDYCEYYCKPVAKIDDIPNNISEHKDACQQPAVSGSCDQSIMVWFYDADNGVCSQFTYSGCDGNDNRFGSKEDCERQCIISTTKVPETTTSTTTTTTTTTVAPVVIPSECEVTTTLEDCRGTGEVWYLQDNECVSYDNRVDGAGCRHTGVFTSEEACERACGSFRNIDVCRFDQEAGPCLAALPKVFYNSITGQCEPFIYGGCHGGPNRFSSIAECEQVCRPAVIDPCTQLPEQGDCDSYSYQWYYHQPRDSCEQFIYGGCNGNANRFETRQECEGRCKKSLTTTVSYEPPPSTTPSTIPTIAPITTTHEPVVEGECLTPSSLAPCGDNVTVYYYDSKKGVCMVGSFGACGYRNSYRTEEECERKCGAFRGFRDVCRYPLDPGPCLAEINKYYWDPTTARCLTYAYGGCDGGPNRFSTVDECEEICRHLRPEPACLHAVSSGTALCGSPGRRWYYDATSGDCLPFVFGGCDGNDNNFVNYDECATLCKRTQEPDLSNEVDCDSYDQECASLSCKYGVQRTHVAGCERCTCVPEDVNCALLGSECDQLICTYGKQRVTGSDGCERCTCNQPPCAGTECAPGERCVTSPYRDPLTQEVRYTTDCRIVNKTGWCPTESSSAASERQCRRDCHDDADCLGVGKCCERGCSSLCLEPILVLPTQPTTLSPDVPHAPVANVVETKPEVRASEGGKATLQCVFHGNPPPKITWRWGAITIEGDLGRYRLLSDGSLEIVSLYRNDSGVYICVADNEYGSAMQEIRLEVDDPVEDAAGISGESNKVIRGQFGHPLSIRCLSYGYPDPMIFWYHGREGSLVPYSSSNYEARGNVLKIHKLLPETVGEYTCQAYNGVGKPADWTVLVEAYNDEDIDQPFVVSRSQEVGTAASIAEPTTPTTPTTPILEIPVFTVPVNTRISSERTRVLAGSEINLPCDVDGYPLPAVHWTKDGSPLENNERITVTEARLTVLHANPNDTGVYGCHAANAYSRHYSTIGIRVEGLYIPSNCKDNPYFANCPLIVKSKFCHHEFYSKFCCKSCVEAGQLDPNELTMQADSWMRRK